MPRIQSLPICKQAANKSSQLRLRREKSTSSFNSSKDSDDAGSFTIDIKSVIATAPVEPKHDTCVIKGALLQKKVMKKFNEMAERALHHYECNFPHPKTQNPPRKYAIKQKKRNNLRI